MKATKTHQEKAKRCLTLIKQGKGEAHWAKDTLGMTYDFEFNNGSFLTVRRYKSDNKYPYYILSYISWNKNYEENNIYLKTTNMIGMKIFNTLKEVYNSTKTYPE